MPMPKLHIIVASTRPSRLGPAVARWFEEAARRHGGFELRVVDLAEVDLPMFNEPHHPAMRKYEHEHTKRWSATIEEADAFVFVMPEYNYGPPPSLVNAIDYLVKEWQYKPVGFVSYGGVSGGLRAVQAPKLSISALKLVGLPEAVTIPFFAQSIEEGTFKPKDVDEIAAKTMLDELVRWAEALKPLRS